MNSLTVADVLVNATLALIMLGIGTSLRFNDFRDVFRNPKSVVAGLTSQMLAMPLIAFVIAAFSDLSPELKLGLIIVSVCPGGTSSNLITHLLRGNVALAISFTIANSLLILFTIPLIVNLGLVYFMGEATRFKIPFWSTVGHIFVICLLPVFVGMVVRLRKHLFAQRVQYPLKFVMPGMLGLVFAIKIFGDKSDGGVNIVFSEIVLLTPYVLALNIVGMTFGCVLAYLLRLGIVNQFTISIEVGLQNTALALLISGSILQSIEMQKPALVYAMYTFFTAVLFALFVIKVAKYSNRKV